MNDTQPFVPASTDERHHSDDNAQDGFRRVIKYMGRVWSEHDLLLKYNPLLVILPYVRPENTENYEALRRPGALWRGDGRGDYHPCSAEFFLSLVAASPKRRSWLSTKRRSTPQPDPPGSIKAKVLAGEPTEAWELDVASFAAGNPTQAWDTYMALISKALDPVGVLTPSHDPVQPVVYCRCQQYDETILLQYWYLYLYNDAVNTHEGDWEMVTLEVDCLRGPQRVGYAGHESGRRRAWQGVTRRGDRPVVYVARGSHAGYLDHLPLGHRTGNLDFAKNLPFPLGLPISILQKAISKFIFFGGVRDYTPSIGDEGDGRIGDLVDPELKVLPLKSQVDDDAWLARNPEWWWMRLDCRWGSSHARLRDFLGPLPPWRKASWNDPLGWLCGLKTN